MGPEAGEGEQGTICPSIIFSTSSNTVLGMDATALQWRSSSWLDADERKLTMCRAGVSVSPVPMCLWFTEEYS